MSDQFKDIKAAIDIAVKAQTFTPDALKAFDEALGMVTELEERRKGCETKISKLEARIRALEGDVSCQYGELTEWRQRELELIEREKTHADLEKEVAVSQAKAAAYEDINHRMLGNRGIRERVQTNATDRQEGYTDPNTGSWVNPPSATRSEDVTTDREET